MSGCPVRLHGQDFQSDPGSLYEGMRAEHGPVVPVTMEGDVPAWLVIGYRELHHVLNSPGVFARSSRRWNAWHLVPENWPRLPMVIQMPSVLFSEGAEHRRRSGAVSDALAGTDLHELRTTTARMADRLIDAFCATNGTDLRTSYTARLPALVLSWMYGLDDARGDRFTDDMNKMIDGGPDAMQAQQALVGAMGELVAERRVKPGPDVVSRLLGHSAGYTDEEAVPELIVVLGGGNQPTAEWLGNALRLMFTDPRFRSPKQRAGGAQRGPVGGHTHADPRGTLRRARRGAGRTAGPAGRPRPPRHLRSEPGPARELRRFQGRCPWQPGAPVVLARAAPVPLSGT
jgi:cytochrome P450